MKIPNPIIIRQNNKQKIARATKTLSQQAAKILTTRTICSDNEPRSHKDLKIELREILLKPISGNYAKDDIKKSLIHLEGVVCAFSDYSQYLLRPTSNTYKKGDIKQSLMNLDAIMHAFSNYNQYKNSINIVRQAAKEMGYKSQDKGWKKLIYSQAYRHTQEHETVVKHISKKLLARNEEGKYKLTVEKLISKEKYTSLAQLAIINPQFTQVLSNLVSNDSNSDSLPITQEKSALGLEKQSKKAQIKFTQNKAQHKAKLTFCAATPLVFTGADGSIGAIFIGILGGLLGAGILAKLTSKLTMYNDLSTLYNTQENAKEETNKDNGLQLIDTNSKIATLKDIFKHNIHYLKKTEKKIAISEASSFNESVDNIIIEENATKTSQPINPNVSIGKPSDIIVQNTKKNQEQEITPQIISEASTNSFKMQIEQKAKITRIKWEKACESLEKNKAIAAQLTTQAEIIEHNRRCRETVPESAPKNNETSSKMADKKDALSIQANSYQEKIIHTATEEHINESEENTALKPDELTINNALDIIARMKKEREEKMMQLSNKNLNNA
jgi:hypothetical protein